MNASREVLAHIDDLLCRLPRTRPLVLGFSGGVDSSVLLEGLVRSGLGSDGLLPVHVHHGLAGEADDWAAHCMRFARARGLNPEVEQVTVERGSNLEARARAARHAALLRHVPVGGTLVLAHHRDDQAETVLLRLFRGAGIAGLAGMQVLDERGDYRLARPLLPLARETIETAARSWGLDWIEDPANADSGADRNFLRHQVRPLLAQRWPAADTRLAAMGERSAEATELLDERAAEDFAACRGSRERLALPPFRTLSPARQRNLLHWWCRRRGIRPPGRALWDQLGELFAAGEDHQPRLTWPEGCLTRFADELYLLHPEQLEPVTESRAWSVTEAAELDFGPWRLQRDGAGPALLLRSDIELLDVAPLAGGERLLSNGMHKRVVELWREAGVPPWERRRLPLLHAGGDLVAVPGIGVADNWRPEADDPGLVIAIADRTSDPSL